MKRALVFVAIVMAVIIALWLFLSFNCPNAGIAFTRYARLLHVLKNRTTLPRETDFDPNVTLESILQPANDANRWSADRAARIEGEVIDVAYARPEATNCFSPCRRDIHILIANRSGAAKNEQMVLEVTPNWQDSARKQGIDWSEQTLRSQLIGHWCDFEGWLYFDVGHAGESENIAPHNRENWRATAWEIHPVTRITVIR